VNEPRPHAVVVGGSLPGLCAGLALGRSGWTVTIVERAAGEPPGGAELAQSALAVFAAVQVDAAIYAFSIAGDQD
jgi:salicylate hydroxylase